MGNDFKRLEKRLDEQAIANEKHYAHLELMMQEKEQERRRQHEEVKDVVNKNRDDINSVVKGVKYMHDMMAKEKKEKKEREKNKHGLDDDIFKKFMMRMSLTNEGLTEVLK